jgi:S-(hydroxymethyl)glutathione dehydrogenase/alcohol dehydrogenase
MMRALIYDGTDAQIVSDIEMDGPGPGEVVVSIRAAGLCHSDVSVLDGTIPFPPPVVLGHEGAGVIEEVGQGVGHLSVGDHVILSTIANCGVCAPCSQGRPTHCVESMSRFPQPYRRGDERLFQFAATGAFAERTVVSAAQAVRVDPDIPFEVAALVGCGVITGVGAVLNRAKVQPDESAAVIGVGGIGLNVIQGLRLAHAHPIIAVDTNPSKQALAEKFGATHFVLAQEGVDTVQAVTDLTGGRGTDYAFECVGHPTLIRQSLEMCATGGSAVVLGVPSVGTEASFMVFTLYYDKAIIGCRYGGARPHHDFPMIIDLYRNGALLLDELVTATYPLTDFDDALAAMRRGDLARGVLLP